MPSSVCIGHEMRTARKNKITKMLNEPSRIPNKSKKVLIKKGPVSVESSLNELENFYSNGPEWKVIEDGGVLGVPVQEYRLTHLPVPNREGNVVFGERKGPTRKQIDHYTVAETIGNLNAVVKKRYDEVKVRAINIGKSVSKADAAAEKEARHLPEFQAVNMWQDIEAEINVKVALEKMMRSLKIPALVIRSVNLKAISPLVSLGISLPDGGGEIDIILAYASGDSLHVVLFEVKRCDTYPWQDRAQVPSKQAVNKAENQLSKDLDVLKALLAGIPPSRVEFHTLACYPDSSLNQLEFCSACLRESVVCQEDIGFLLNLRKKTRIFYDPTPATGKGNEYLLTLSARLLSHQSLLHVGYRELADKEKLARDKHTYNRKSVDRKLMQSEFVVASPQQQEVIEKYKSGRLAERHLGIEGPAGTGKTLVALQVAKHLLESINKDRETREDGQDLMKTTEEMDNEGKDICSGSGLAMFLRSAPKPKYEEILDCHSRNKETKAIQDLCQTEKAKDLGGCEKAKSTEALQLLESDNVDWETKERDSAKTRNVQKQDDIKRELLQRQSAGFFPRRQCNECEYTCRSLKVLKDHVMMEHTQERYKYKRRYNPQVEGPVLIVTAGTSYLRAKDPILNYLDEITKDVAMKFCLGWEELCRSLAIRYDSDLPSLLKAISRKWCGREIVMVVDEIIDLGPGDFFWVPNSVRLILVFNPLSHLTMPPQIVRVSLTVPYRSTKSITSLTRFVAKKMNMKTLGHDGEIGSDVEGELPMYIDATAAGGKMQLGDALAFCR